MKYQRRVFFKKLGLLSVFVPFLRVPSLMSQDSREQRKEEEILMKKIPKSQESIAALGMGTWITFNVGSDQRERNVRGEILREFFKAGGGGIDSSPMYGSAEEVVGDVIKDAEREKLFSATKIWTRSTSEGPKQFENSLKLWREETFDLQQVHNLVNYEDHLNFLVEMKKQKKIRYVGITTSHGRRHSEFEKLMESENLDFIQMTYNILDREIEKRILPLAREKKIAVIANRPFQRGALIDRFKGKALPGFAKEIGCKTWPQFLLKFIISHPDITCAIPATSKVDHMKENMQAQRGVMPDQKMRERMIEYTASL